MLEMSDYCVASCISIGYLILYVVTVKAIILFTELFHKHFYSVDSNCKLV